MEVASRHSVGESVIKSLGRKLAAVGRFALVVVVLVRDWIWSPGATGTSSTRTLRTPKTKTPSTRSTSTGTSSGHRKQPGR